MDATKAVDECDSDVDNVFDETEQLWPQVTQKLVKVGVKATI
ncbi:hypothetical protein Tco_0464024, partial [Tanacetum coccineum]